MIETKFNEFFRSPKGILLVMGIIMLGAVLVLLFVARVFRGLIEPTPYIFD